MKNLLENSRGLLWLGFQRQTVDARERTRDVAGAVLGLLLTGGFSWWAWGADSVWLGAPMGASAVLLFAVPSSPLAQPWPAVVWAAASSVDTNLSFLSSLELYRADVPDGRVPTPGVVEALDVVEHV